MVQVGDQLDRGDDELAIIELLEVLKLQAEKAGGGLHVLVGNHETMNAQGNFMYATDGAMEKYDRWNKVRILSTQAPGLRALDAEQAPYLFTPSHAFNPEPFILYPRPKSTRPYTPRDSFYSICIGRLALAIPPWPNPLLVPVSSTPDVPGSALSPSTLDPTP